MGAKVIYFSLLKYFRFLGFLFKNSIEFMVYLWFIFVYSKINYTPFLFANKQYLSHSYINYFIYLTFYMNFFRNLGAIQDKY